MKKILLATTLLAASTTLVAAEITLSGDARMGIIGGSGVDTSFTSRARVKFTMSGETDGGLSFGASFRADNAGDDPDTKAIDGAVNGRAGEVFISGAFGKLTMGDIDGAAEQAVGNVDGVGLTDLSDYNKAVYFGAGSGSTDPTAAYEYSSGAFTGIISATNPGSSPSAYAVGLKYAAGDYTVALGYEDDSDNDYSQVIIGATAKLGAVSLKGNYGQIGDSGDTYVQYHLSATYTADALALTAFYTDEDYACSCDTAGTSYGVGAKYDLGGGAKVLGGYVKDQEFDIDYFDLGVSFTF